MGHEDRHLQVSQVRDAQGPRMKWAKRNGITRWRGFPHVGTLRIAAPTLKDWQTLEAKREAVMETWQPRSLINAAVRASNLTRVKPT